jgi:hypothetical protein
MFANTLFMFFSRIRKKFAHLYTFGWYTLMMQHQLASLYLWMVLPPSQIIRHSKNLRELNDLKFDQIYMIR